MIAIRQTLNQRCMDCTATCIGGQCIFWPYNNDSTVDNRVNIGNYKEPEPVILPVKKRKDKPWEDKFTRMFRR